jgi:hypothetical protein
LASPLPNVSERMGVWGRRPQQVQGRALVFLHLFLPLTKRILEPRRLAAMAILARRSW